MPIHRRRYFQLVERDPNTVSPSWKVFHALLFILIVVMSFISALTFHDIFQSFNFQCILYGKPEIHLDKIVFFTSTTPASTTSTLTTSAAGNISTLTTSVTTSATTPSTTNASAMIPERPTPMLAGNTTKVKPKKEPLKIEIKGRSYWATNSTLTAKVMVNHRNTVYGSRDLCNAVLFFPLATLVFGTFAAVIVIICGRGGRGYQTDLFPQPWLYVCPLLILSIIMLIVNAILVTLLSRGMYQFCSAFKEYTGQERCSKNINYFTDDEGFGLGDLYQTYYLCIVSFTAGVILWALQVALLVMRVFCVVDFQLVMVRVSCKRRHSLEFGEVHQVLTKFHKLKKVTFADKEDTKKNKDDDVTQV